MVQRTAFDGLTPVLDQISSHRGHSVSEPLFLEPLLRQRLHQEFQRVPRAGDAGFEVPRVFLPLEERIRKRTVRILITAGLGNVPLNLLVGFHPHTTQRGTLT